MDAAAREFIASVLALRPHIAVFDCDGTLWAGDTGAEFFDWEVRRGLLPNDTVRRITARYEGYKRGEVSEAAMCGEMVTIHAGLPEPTVAAAGEEFFAERPSSHIFAEMVELVSRLRQAGCDMWAVSSTNDWVVRAGVRRFGIAPERVLAACVEVEQGIVTDRLRNVPTGLAKATVIRQQIGERVDAAFGNSIHDLQMLELARHPFVVNPTSELAKVAQARRWPIYIPAILRNTPAVTPI